VAGPYASLTSPYAPNHMDSALRIADLIGQQGRSAAQAKYARRMMVGDLIGGIGNTVGNIFARHDQQKTQQADAQKLADLLSSGQPVDLPTLIRDIGPERAKAMYPVLEAELKKREAAAEAKQQGEARQAFADSVLNNPASTPEQKAAVALWMKTGGKVTPPTGLGPDPAAATAAAAQKKLDAKNALLAQAAEAIKHGMSRVDAQQWYGAQTGGESLPKEWFGEDPPKVERKLITVPGPGGVPVQRYATEEELEKGVQTYRAPTGPASPGPLVPVVGPDGVVRYGTREQAIGTPTPAGSEKPSSGQQKRVLNFFNRAEQADRDLEAMEPQIQKMNLAGQTWQAWAPNFAQTQLGQSYTAAQRAFTEARLRKDSGAAIPTEEYENDQKTYFAQPGDSQTTLEQKRRARAAMLASLAFESGQALGEYVGGSDEAKAIVERYKTRSATGGTPPAAVPDGVKRALANKIPNPPPLEPYVLGNGTKWRKNTDGSITQVQ